MTARKNPPLLVRSALTGSVYILTRYRITGQHPVTGADLITASEKWDVTERFNELAREAARP